MDLKEESILGAEIDKHWYYSSKAEAALRYVGTENCGSILDVGAGSGFFTRYLLQNTQAKEAVCVDTSYPGERSETFGSKCISYRVSCNDAYDHNLVLMMDVLEHVDDDLELLSHYVGLARTGTRFLVTVPAFEFLWSSHDVYLEHRRRYTLRRLTDVMELAGLKVLSSAYHFGSVFPIAATLRLAERLASSSHVQPRSHLKVHSRYVNGMLRGLCKLDLAALGRNRVAGLSVFGLGRKP